MNSAPDAPSTEACNAPAILAVAGRSGDAGEAFQAHPHRTVVALSIPVLGSLIAEPLTGWVDTLFIADYGGEDSLTSLGIGVGVLSALFWVFNFLSIGTQSEVSQWRGSGRWDRCRSFASLALLVASLLGVAVAALGLWQVGAVTKLMSHNPLHPVSDDVIAAAEAYLGVRFWGSPAILIMNAAFGFSRGLANMRVPLMIAVAQNALNVLFDALLIYGWGPFPELGISGAAWAAVISQWIGALLSVAWITSVTGRLHAPRWGDLGRLFTLGRDLVLRAALLHIFLLYTIRWATLAGVGGAHQGVRSTWLLAAFGLDAFAITAQTLVGTFHGRGEIYCARRAAAITTVWGVLLGTAVGLAMWLSEEAFVAWLDLQDSRQVFVAGWRIAALSMPVNAVSFVTDGIHWGTRDYRYLRNVMLLATGGGVLLLESVGAGGDAAVLGNIWWIVFAWITVRALFGIVRIWPAMGRAPLRAGLGETKTT